MAREHQDVYVWEGARENAKGHPGRVGVPEVFGYTRRSLVVATMLDVF